MAANIRESAESKYWPSRVGRLILQRSVASMLAIYADPESGDRYAAGCERGGRRRRGWWFKEVDESKRGDGYRDFSPRTRDEAISELRTAAGITGQARLGEFGVGAGAGTGTTQAGN